MHTISMKIQSFLFYIAIFPVVLLIAGRTVFLFAILWCERKVLRKSFLPRESISVKEYCFPKEENIFTSHL